MDQDQLGDLIGMNQRNQTNQLLRNLEAQRRGVGGCPYCGGGLPKIGVSLCMHCRNQLVWSGNVVGKKGEEQAVAKRHQEINESTLQKKVDQYKKSKVIALFGLIWGCWALFGFISKQSFGDGFMFVLMPLGSGAIGIITSIASLAGCIWLILGVPGYLSLAADPTVKGAASNSPKAKSTAKSKAKPKSEAQRRRESIRKAQESISMSNKTRETSESRADRIRRQEEARKRWPDF